MISTRITQFAIAAVVMSLVVGLCGCDQLVDILVSPDENKDVPTPDGPISMDIGIVVGLTGEYAMPYGLSMQRGFNLVRDEIDNTDPETLPVRLNFIVEDDMSTVDGAVAAVERLIEAGVPAIVGITLSAHVAQAFPIAQDNQVVAFSPLSSAAGLSSIGEYIFRSALAVDKMNPSGVKITHAQLGYERVAMIYDDADLYSNSSNEHLAIALADLGVEVATTQTFQTGDTDFTTQLTSIMETNPDALFISGLAPEIMKVMVQGREAGVTSQYIIPELSMTEVDMVGEAAEGAITFTSWISTSDNPLNQAFVESYQAAYGIAPDTWAAQSYATLAILYQAILDAMLMNPAMVPDSTAIRDALAMVKDFDTNLGSFSFDANGEAVYEPVVLVVKDGSLELFGDGVVMSQ